MPSRDPRHRIGRHGERQRRIRVRQRVVPDVLPRVGVGIRELDVREQPVRARNRDIHRVEHLAMRLVLVEPEIEEVAHVHPGRRDAAAVGPADAGVGRAARQRVRVAGIVAHRVAEKRGDVPRHHVAEPHHHRIARRIDQLVEAIAREAVEQADVGPRGHEARRPRSGSGRTPSGRRQSGRAAPPGWLRTVSVDRDRYRGRPPRRRGKRGSLRAAA